VTGVTCEVFQDAVDELALGQVAEPLRTRLLDHAGTCVRCGTELAELSAVADRLLELAPEAAPPVGFEQRVVLGAHTPRRRTRPRRWLVPAAVAAALVGVVLLGVQDRAEPPSTVLGTDGAPAGTVDVTGGRLVLALDEEADWPGTWACEVRTAGGRWVEVGTWTAADVVDRLWSTPVEAEVVDGATAMRVLSGRGDVLYTAALD